MPWGRPMKPARSLQVSSMRHRSEIKEGRLLPRGHKDTKKGKNEQKATEETEAAVRALGLRVLSPHLSIFILCVLAFLRVLVSLWSIFAARVGLSILDSRLAFEGAHLLRRCAPCFKSAHLGKARSFLRRCAPFCKVRTKKCASTTPPNAGIRPPCWARGLLCARGDRL